MPLHQLMSGFTCSASSYEFMHLCWFLCPTFAHPSCSTEKTGCYSIAWLLWRGLQYAAPKVTICDALVEATIGCTALLDDIMWLFCVHARVATLRLLHLQQVALVISTVHACEALG
mmetsp:Transcript_8303/g.51733  ORF Transcript_8303/g.51733 Transcript_8303/m.51733 type:complete len:116 (+) Transcript_8303:2057-2404(+)